METNVEVDKNMFAFLFECPNHEISKNNSNELAKFTEDLKKFELHVVQDHTVKGRTLLQYYTELGLVEYVRHILDLGINPNIVNPDDGKTAIHYAAENGHWQALELFIQRAINISDTVSNRQSFDSTDCFTEVPINFRALTKNHENIIHIILQRPKLDELAQMIVGFAVLRGFIFLFRILFVSRSMPDVNVIQAE